MNEITRLFAGRGAMLRVWRLVEGAEPITPRMRRVHFSGPDLADLSPGRIGGNDHA